MTTYKSLKFMDFSGYRVGEEGSVWSKKRGSWRRLKPRTNKDGHLYVDLYNSDGVKTFRVHTLVLRAFVSVPKPGQEACHYPDREPTNNNRTNLSWGSRTKNERHKVKHGTDSRGEKSVRAKLTWKKVRKIRKLYGTVSKKTGLVWTAKRLGHRYGVHQVTIGCIIRNETWMVYARLGTNPQP